jgi:uncharacterized membrane protein
VARERKPKPREEHEIEFSRIVAFSDGVFAIAITLLVLNLKIAEDLKSASEVTHALKGQRENLLAFAISFAVIGRFWLVHHRFFGEVKAFDGGLLALNLFYLAWIVLIPFSSQVLGEYGGQTASVVLYSANLCAVILTSLWMAADARRAGLTETDDLTHRETWIRSTFIAGVFLLSIPLAFVVPHLAPYFWLLLFLDPAPRLARRTIASR